jgi:hypothetical protein
MDASQREQEQPNTKAEESMTLEAITRQPVKTQQTEKSERMLVVNCRMCGLAIALLLIFVTNLKRLINPVTSPIPIYTHLPRGSIMNVIEEK